MLYVQTQADMCSNFNRMEVHLWIRLYVYFKQRVKCFQEPSAQLQR